MKVHLPPLYRRCIDRFSGCLIVLRFPRSCRRWHLLSVSSAEVDRPSEKGLSLFFPNTMGCAPQALRSKARPMHPPPPPCSQTQVWLGGLGRHAGHREETSADERGVAAYKTVELDDLFDGGCSQSRQIQGKDCGTPATRLPTRSGRHWEVRRFFDHTCRLCEALWFLLCVRGRLGRSKCFGGG